MAHLSKQERCKIENFLITGVTPQEMARKLGRTHTTINRELKRHRQEEDPDHRRCTNYCVFSKKCDKYKVCNLPPHLHSETVRGYKQLQRIIIPRTCQTLP